MSALTDISNLISAINQRSDADDIANQYTAGQLPDTGPIPGSGMVTAWAQQHGTEPIPAGLAALAGQAQQKVLGQIGESVATGQMDPMTAYGQVARVTGGDPSALIKLRAMVNAFGGGGTQAPTAGTPALQQVSQMNGSGGDSNPSAPAPQSLPGAVVPAQSTPAAAPLSQGGNLAIAGINPMEIMKTQSELAKNAAETGLANANTKKSASETVTNPTGGAITPGQKTQDEEFGKSFMTFQDSGGAKNINIASQKIDDTIKALQSGQLQTGRMTDRFAYDGEGHPTYSGKAIDPQIINAKSNLDGAVLPLLKPLFGARVTNFDAQSALNAYGLNPVSTNQENVQRLQDLKLRLKNGQQDLSKAGEYWTKNGTLAGYGGNVGAEPATMGGAPMVHSLQTLLGEASKRGLKVQ